MRDRTHAAREVEACLVSPRSTRAVLGPTSVAFVCRAGNMDERVAHDGRRLGIRTFLLRRQSGPESHGVLLQVLRDKENQDVYTNGDDEGVYLARTRQSRLTRTTATGPRWSYETMSQVPAVMHDTPRHQCKQICLKKGSRLATPPRFASPCAWLGRES